MPAVADPQVELSEEIRVFLRRYEEARVYGFTEPEARAYAGSGIDSGELRRLIRAKVPPPLAARILL